MLSDCFVIPGMSDLEIMRLAGSVRSGLRKCRSETNVEALIESIRQNVPAVNQQHATRQNVLQILHTLLKLGEVLRNPSSDTWFRTAHLSKA